MGKDCGREQGGGFEIGGTQGGEIDRVEGEGGIERRGGQREWMSEGGQGERTCCVGALRGGGEGWERGVRRGGWGLGGVGKGQGGRWGVGGKEEGEEGEAE